MGDVEEWSGPTRRAALGAALGAAGTLGLGLLRGRLLARGPGGPALWAADRADHRVVGIDRDGLITAQARVVAPVALRPSPGWPASVVAVSAPAAARAGPRVAVALDAAGQVAALPPGAGPSSTPGPWCDPAEGAHDPPGWRLLRRAGRPRAPATTLLERRAAGGRVAFRIRLPFAAGAACADEEGIWVADALRGRVVRVTATGRVVVDVNFPDAGGADAVLTATAREGGGAWIACGGALLRIDARGRRMPGQGGFRHLVALARAR